MNISKLKVVLKYMTGGIESVIEYLLDLFNEMIAKLPAEEVAKYAQLAKDVAVFVSNLCVLIPSEAKKVAAKKTAECFEELAAALIDSKMDKEELDVIIEKAKIAIKAWKDAK